MRLKNNVESLRLDHGMNEKLNCGRLLLNNRAGRVHSSAAGDAHLLWLCLHFDDFDSDFVFVFNGHHSNFIKNINVRGFLESFKMFSCGSRAVTFNNAWNTVETAVHSGGLRRRGQSVGSDDIC